MPARTSAPRRSVEWSKDRIASLQTADINQLRVNAERLNDPEIMGRCDEVLRERKVAEKLARQAARKPVRKVAA